MDLLGDIVEKDPSSSTSSANASASTSNQQSSYPSSSATTGFPELYKPSKISSWKHRLKAKKQQQQQQEQRPATRASPRQKTSEAQSIHNENLNTLQNMTDEQIINEQRELLQSLNPKLIKNLLANINKRTEGESSAPLFAEIEGASGTWVGGKNENFKHLPSLSDDQVNKALDIQNLTLEDEDLPTVEAHTEKEQDNDDDDDDDADDVAPLDYQMAQTIDHMSNEELMDDVHFVKQENTTEQLLDINDPNFNEKLHERFFPDLPKDIDKLQWMEPVPDLSEETKQDGIVISDVSQCRLSLIHI